MRLSPRFLLSFFALAGVLFAVWSFAGAGDAYGRAVVALATPFIERLTDCRVVEVRQVANGLSIEIERTDPSDGRVYRRTVPLQPREVFSGTIPFLSLMFATGGLALGTRLRRTGLGLAVMFAFHFGLMLIGPYLTGLPQAHLAPETIRGVVQPAIDVFYAFYGLVGYAALPFLLWFWLGRTPPPAAD